MRCFAILLLLIMTSCLESPAAFAKPIDVWFGTSTSRGGLSQGIYHGTFDTDSGKLSQPTLAYEISSPGFLAMHPGGEIIYSTAVIDGKPSAAALAIVPDSRGKKLRLINSHEIGDGGAAHLSTDKTGTLLLTAQYGGGSTALFSLGEDGSITDRITVAKHGKGSGVVSGRQDKAHAHWTGVSPDNRFAFVPDLGLDKVVIWKLNVSTPGIQSHGFGICPPGGGPRHMKFHPTGKYIYVLNELALSVTAFHYDPALGTMSAIQTLPTVPEDQKAKEQFNSASEIRIHPNGNFVYAANRGNDTITAFRIDQATGEMTFLQREPIRGSWPRNFNIDPTGKWIIAAGKDSNTASVFKIDQQTGMLQYVTHGTRMVPSSICVLFGK